MIDYEKSYKEALKRAKNFKSPFCQHAAETIFPELRESEDEKIRKQLLNWFKGCHWDSIDDGRLKRDDIIAWLEKQGEQKPSDKIEYKLTWSKEDTKMMDFIINILKCAPDMRPCSEVYHESAYQEQIDWLKSLKPQPKQEWSDTDKEMLQCVIKHVKNSLTGGHPENYTPHSLVYWLERLKPQPRWKPSEEQLKALKNIIIGKRGPLYDLYFDLEKL